MKSRGSMHASSQGSMTPFKLSRVPEALAAPEFMGQQTLDITGSRSLRPSRAFPGSFHLLTGAGHRLSELAGLSEPLLRLHPGRLLLERSRLPQVLNLVGHGMQAVHDRLQVFFIEFYRNSRLLSTKPLYAHLHIDTGPVTMRLRMREVPMTPLGETILQQGASHLSPARP